MYADDHPLARVGCRAILEREGFEVVGEAADGREAVLLTRTHHPDVAVLDVSMPGISGIDAAREILELSPSTPIVCLTMYADEHRVVAALRTGVLGYVVKTAAAEEIATAIRHAVAGRVYVSPRARTALIDRYLACGDPGDPLAPKDRFLVRMIADGKTTKEIAALLGVSVKTAETYRARLIAKLDVHDTAGLVRYAVRSGLIQAVFAGSMILDELLKALCSARP